MKTIAWVPTPSLNTADFALDEEVLFYSLASRQSKRVTLLGALMAAGGYASMNLGFEICNKSQEVLAVFEPGQPVKGYPAIIEGLVIVATHLDNHAKTAVARAVEKLKPEAVRLYEQGVVDGIETERNRAQNALATIEGGQDAPTAEAVAEAPSAPEAAPVQAHQG